LQVEHKNHDKVFFVNFSMVLGALFAIFFVCVGAARLLDTGDIYQDPATGDKLAERIKPIGNAVTDPKVLLAMAPPEVAHEPYTGEQVVKETCSACHGTGVLGAPKIGDGAAWSARKSASGGESGLVASAIKGKGQMPPRGGNPKLSDDEVKGAVEVMLKASGG
jgi:cytochrome c5